MFHGTYFIFKIIQEKCAGIYGDYIPALTKQKESQWSGRNNNKVGSAVK